MIWDILEHFLKIYLYNIYDMCIYMTPPLSLIKNAFILLLNDLTLVRQTILINEFPFVRII